jgi:hypothetical protein
MIYLFYGPDIETSRKKARALFESLRAKKPDAAFGELNIEGLTADKIQELAGGQGLFGNKSVVFCDNIFSDIEAREIAEPFISDFAKSPNIFVILEKEPIKKIFEKLEKNAEKSQKFEEKNGSPKKEWNDFALANALGARNSLKAWKEYRILIERDPELEKIHGQIFWKVKQMILSPYGSSAFKAEELRAKSRDLARMYHLAHRGECDFEIAMEKFLLKL